MSNEIVFWRLCMNIYTLGKTNEKITNDILNSKTNLIFELSKKDFEKYKYFEEEIIYKDVQSSENK